MGVPPVRLRPYRDADLALTAALESDPAVMRHLGGTGGPEREDRIRRVHDRRLAGGARGDWYRAIIVDDDAAPVGLVAIWGDTWQDQHIWEIGAMLLTGHRYKGIAMDAVRALLAEIGAERPLNGLHAFTATGNVAAAGACRALGFTPLGECDTDYEGVPLRCQHWLLRLP